MSEALARLASRSRWWAVWGVVLLGLWLGWTVPGAAEEGLHLGDSLTDYVPLRLPERRWVSLLVNMEEYYPVVEYAETSMTIRSLAVMPALIVQVPDRYFRPYIGLGLGLSVNGLDFETPFTPLSLHVEETLIMHVGAGVVYQLGASVALIASARFAQFKSSDFLGYLSPASSGLVHDGLDFHAYTVGFGIRLVY